MVYDCILGRNFLKIAELGLVPVDRGARKEVVCEFQGEIGTIMSINCEDDNIDLLKVGEDVRYVYRKKLDDMFLKYYLRPRRPLEHRVRSCIRLIVENGRIFICTPLRLF